MNAHMRETERTFTVTVKVKIIQLLRLRLRISIGAAPLLSYVFVCVMGLTHERNFGQA